MGVCTTCNAEVADDQLMEGRCANCTGDAMAEAPAGSDTMPEGGAMPAEGAEPAAAPAEMPAQAPADGGEAAA